MPRPPPPGGPRPPPGFGPPRPFGAPAAAAAAPLIPAPTKKLKNFFWDKLPDMRLGGSVWEGLGPAEWLDWEQMEELFAQVRRCWAFGVPMACLCSVQSGFLFCALAPILSQSVDGWECVCVGGGGGWGRPSGLIGSKWRSCLHRWVCFAVAGVQGDCFGPYKVTFIPFACRHVLLKHSGIGFDKLSYMRLGGSVWGGAGAGRVA